MKNTFASKLKELRRERGMGQEQLASVCGVSVQAVSKWECEQSYPDIELLATIADTFGVTIDSLLRADKETEKAEAKDRSEAASEAASVDDRLLGAVAEKFGVKKEDIGSVDIRMGTGGEDVTIVPKGVAELPDDGVLRVVQFLGRRPLSVRELERDGGKIPLELSGFAGWEKITVQIVGDAELFVGENQSVYLSVSSGGDMTVSAVSVNSTVNAGGDVTIEGAPVNGNINAGRDVAVGAGSDGCVNGNLSAGGNIYCGSCGSVSACGNVDCGSVAGSISAGGEVNCGTVEGSIEAEGSVDCGNVEGNVCAEGDVSCGNVGSDVNAGGDVECGNVDGDVNAGGDVSCADVDGDVSAGGSIECGEIAGDVSAEGDVSCADVDGDVSAGGSVDCGEIAGAVSSCGGINCDGSIRIVTGREKKKRDKFDVDISDFDIDIPDLSDLGEKISRSVNDALERAFGKRSGEKTGRGSGETECGDDDDEMMRRALEIAVDSGKISISIIEKRLRLSYYRAARLIDMMAERGYISRESGERFYMVTITREKLDELYGKRDEDK